MKDRMPLQSTILPVMMYCILSPVLWPVVPIGLIRVCAGAWTRKCRLHRRRFRKPAVFLPRKAYLPVGVVVVTGEMFTHVFNLQISFVFRSHRVNVEEIGEKLQTHRHIRCDQADGVFHIKSLDDVKREVVLLHMSSSKYCDFSWLKVISVFVLMPVGVHINMLPQSARQ